MACLDIVGIGNTVQLAYGLHMAVVAVLPDTNAGQRIPGLDHIAYRLRLLGFDVRDGRPLGRYLLRIGVVLRVRIERFLGLVRRRPRFRRIPVSSRIPVSDRILRDRIIRNLLRSRTLGGLRGGGCLGGTARHRLS